MVMAYQIQVLLVLLLVFGVPPILMDGQVLVLPTPMDEQVLVRILNLKDELVQVLNSLLPVLVVVERLVKRDEAEVQEQGPCVRNWAKAFPTAKVQIFYQLVREEVEVMNFDARQQELVVPLQELQTGALQILGVLPQTLVNLSLSLYLYLFLVLFLLVKKGVYLKLLVMGILSLEALLYRFLCLV